MPTIQQLLESQEKEFEKFKEVWNSKHSEFIRIPDAIKQNILNWHKQSIIALYEAEIFNALKQRRIPNYQYEEDGKKQRREDNVYNKALDEVITHYKQVIEELRK